ncbi:MAG: polysaccharide biosynthesis protein [Rhodoglobus sp.]
MATSGSASRRVRKVLIAGRGVAGTTLAADVTASGDIVVGYLDDRLQGEDVLGTLADIAEVRRSTGAEVVYFAIPSATADVLQRFIRDLPPDTEFAIIPRTYRIVARDRVSVSDLTDVDVLDLVGRAPVKHDMIEARAAIGGKRIMVTGAAGSIGSRVVQQALSLGPASVIGVDRSESGMFHLGQSMIGQENLQLAIGDIQSEARMSQLLERYAPDYLFHVAAYKHVPLMQENPIEAVNNNVWGSLNVLAQAGAHGVGQVVYVSTDKAVNPTNVMGATKRLGELMLRDLAHQFPGTKYNGVRFGNVLESEGSVMQTFRRQLQSHQDLTVTDPEITRFFMTIDEASQLIIQSATAGRPGDLFVLDMGEPIRVLDLARALIDVVDPTLDVQTIGLRPGEKMFEELSYASSQVDSTTHPKIFVVLETAEHAPGRVVEWARETTDMTRSYSISDDDLVERIRAFGFPDLP